MEIEYRTGDVTKATQRIIAHGCNAQGKMGSGVALAIREEYPEAYIAYRTRHEKYGLKVGFTVWAFTKDKMIANCITQEFYGYDGRQYVDYEAIRTCMKELNTQAKIVNEEEVAMPAIGAARGGGDWDIISKIIEEEFTNAKPVVYLL